MEPLQVRGQPAQARRDVRGRDTGLFDPAAVVEEDLFAVDEERWTVIGRSDTGLLFVVFTERRNNVVRIISARLANPHERRRYRAV